MPMASLVFHIPSALRQSQLRALLVLTVSGKIYSRSGATFNIPFDKKRAIFLERRRIARKCHMRREAAVIIYFV